MGYYRDYYRDYCNFIECVASKRANEVRLKVGETRTIDGFWYKCERFANRSVIYTEGTMAFEAPEMPYLVSRAITVSLLPTQIYKGSEQARLGEEVPLFLRKL